MSSINVEPNLMFFSKFANFNMNSFHYKTYFINQTYFVKLIHFFNNFRRRNLEIAEEIMLSEDEHCLIKIYFLQVHILEQLKVYHHLQVPKITVKLHMVIIMDQVEELKVKTEVNFHQLIRFTSIYQIMNKSRNFIKSNDLKFLLYKKFKIL